MRALLISDLHLSPERPDITRAFFQFLQTQASTAAALYILGDLFEAWIGDDDPSPLSRDVIEKLKILSDTGTRLYFQHGNRDFMVGKQFARETGATLLPEHAVVTLNEKRVLLLHGDTLCLDDVDYQKFRRKARNPLFKWFVRRLPLKKRQQMAADWRAKSMAANTNKADNIMDVTPAEVERMFAQYHVNTMIHGHTHRPARHQHSNGERIALGDWHKTGWLVDTANSDLQLLEFDL
ncbi:MAG: UDP-2,3-diacylglucosamine diphosphatase [Porticoccaceae bacterium]|nr:UDP-2,3-diacylglucosamine diphosphatase [Pseudomonadales bacterium]MCP5171490.1 UDP-2,3-diacylglucosamine diphosphatase [Pseudomonadales bacterium]